MIESNFKFVPILDAEHLEWIRHQPCYFCGMSAESIRMTPHHVGDGIHKHRSRDDITLPACFGYTNNPKKPMGCHRYCDDNKGEYDIDKLRADANEYWNRHNIERGME